MAKDLTDYYREYHKARYLAKKELLKAQTKAYREANKEKYKKYDEEGKKRNRAKLNATESYRRALKSNATPSWLTDEHRQAIDRIYDEANSMGYHVDHIIPLKNKIVCGMHVPWNLQAIPAQDNLRKSNKFEGI